MWYDIREFFIYMSDVESKESNRRNEKLDQKKDVDGSLNLRAAAQKRVRNVESTFQRIPSSIPRNGPDSKKSNQAGESEKEQREKRKINSPDLNDAVEQLKPQVLSFKKFLDGSRHNEQGQKIVTIADVQTEADTLNSAIKSYRDQGKKVRAIDLWGASLEISATPDVVAIRPPALSGKMLQKYVRNREAFHSAQATYIRIDSDGVSLVKEDQERADEISRTSTFDTLLFHLHETGLLDKYLVMTLPYSATDIDYWQEIDKRAREYGFTVESENVKNTNNNKRYEISIDLQSSEWKIPNGRYLRIEAGLSTAHWDRSRVFLSDKKGFK